MAILHKPGQRACNGELGTSGAHLLDDLRLRRQAVHVAPVPLAEALPLLEEGLLVDAPVGRQKVLEVGGVLEVVHLQGSSGR